MIPPPHYFESIRTKAEQRWNQLESDPDLAGPWHQLFKQVQSPRHVVSELLQNADDAGATEAAVRIDNGVFIFEHNGEDFAEDHFASLCRFGYSNKRTLHTIGFRGIGFKSTFSLGERVELYSPTLSVAFNQRRFTEPLWIASGNGSVAITRVRVPIRDQFRQKEIEKNLDEWFKSPVSLLFFRSIRCLRVSQREMRWSRGTPGPVPRSEWLERAGEGEYKRVLHIRSEEEPFPPEALEEIRQERLVPSDELQDFPPCRVEIVLGAKGRLYVVLPTGVETALPFACNAPFIQDPARIQIKDPEISPTNRWLLGRVGKLASAAMLHWLADRGSPLDYRAAAYDLMPNLRPDFESLEEICGKRVEAAFVSALRERSFLLTRDGELVPRERSVILPIVMQETWPDRDIARLVDPQHRPALAAEISDLNSAKLKAWRMAEEITSEPIIEHVRHHALPKPQSWEQLARFWAYLSPELCRRHASLHPRNLHLVAAKGLSELVPALRAVRLGKSRLLDSEGDWAFVAEYLVIADADWLEFLNQSAEKAEGIDENPELSAAIDKARRLLEVIHLAQPSSLQATLETVANALFGRESVPLTDCVRLAHIAARLNAPVGQGFRLRTRDGYLRPIEHCVLVDTDGGLDYLLPERWGVKHLLHENYGRSFSSCTPEEWCAWIASERSGLHTFVPLELVERDSISPSDELQRRSYTQGYTTTFKNPDFRIYDWDFNEQLWGHWKKLADENPKVWKEISVRLLQQRNDYWTKDADRRSAILVELSSRSKRKQHGLISSGLCPTWALKLRELPCLPDTKGFIRKPHELLLRTAQTEAFIDIEPFIDHSLDTEATKPVLKLLGVRDTPLGPDSILDRLRVLSRAPEPPVVEVEKWYRRLDQLIQTASSENVVSIKDAFASERLIFTAAGNWVEANAVFLAANEDDVPGAEVIRASVANLVFWARIGVADKPSVELAIAWLKTLPAGEKLPAECHRRVRALLGRHSLRIWEDCGHWLNLAGEWVPVDHLDYSMTMQDLIGTKHLYPAVKQKTADFQNLQSAIAADPPFSALPTLASQLENRPVGASDPSQRGERRPWLTTLAREICRIRIEDEEAANRIYDNAADLAETVWRRSPGLELVPYLGGAPVGTPVRAGVILAHRVLYVDEVSEARLARLVPQEIARTFDHPEIRAALDYSYDRTPEAIRSYMEENFDLIAREELAAHGTISDDSHSKDDGSQLTENSSSDTHDVSAEAGEKSGLDGNDGEPTAEEPDGLAFGHELEPETHHQPKRPPQPGILERFVLSIGFQPAGENRYVHEDGSEIVQKKGDILPWERRSPSGEVVRRYWPKDHCIERNPLELPAEVWGFLQMQPALVALILASPRLDKHPIEITGNRLLSLVATDKITLHPASYRLVQETAN